MLLNHPFGRHEMNEIWFLFSAILREIWIWNLIRPTECTYWRNVKMFILLLCRLHNFCVWALSSAGQDHRCCGGEIDADATDGSVGLGKVRVAGDYSHKLQEEWSESQNCSNSQGCINCSGYTAQSILMHYFSNPFLLCFISMCHIHGELERLRKCTHF